jgi:hypothetical protein
MVCQCCMVDKINTPVCIAIGTSMPVPGCHESMGFSLERYIVYDNSPSTTVRTVISSNCVAHGIGNHSASVSPRTCGMVHLASLVLLVSILLKQQQHFFHLLPTRSSCPNLPKMFEWRATWAVDSGVVCRCTIE